MLTADAMNGFKDHVKKTVSHAMYKINSSYYRAEITDIYVDSTGKVAIDFTIDPTMSGTVKIAEVQLYNRSGKLWLTKTENTYSIHWYSMSWLPKRTRIRAKLGRIWRRMRRRGKS